MKKFKKLVPLFATLLLLTGCEELNPSKPSDPTTPTDPVNPDDQDTYYTVEFDLNGGEIADASYIAKQKVKEGHWAKEPTISPTKNHCIFLGWYTSGGTKFDFTTAIYGNIVLTATWQVNEDEKVTLTFDPANGEATFTVDTFLHDTPTIKIPKKAGYVFAGWYYNTNTRWSGIVTSDVVGVTLTAHYEKENFNFSYSINDDDTATITGLLNISATVINIPETINGHVVTTIGARAFNNRVNLQQVTLSKTVQHITGQSFTGCTALTTINVDTDSQYFKSIGGLLYSKDGSEIVYCPRKAITDTQTYDCPANLKKIGDYAFYGQGDTGLKTVTFNSLLEEIGDYAFYGCLNITALTFPSSLKKIGKAAFEILGSTTSNELQISWAEGLEEIGESAFCGPYIKGTLNIPDTVKVLGDYAFSTPANSYCAIEKVKLPASLESFGNGVFFYGTSIETLTLDSSNAKFKVENNTLLSKDGKICYYIPGNAATINADYQLSEGVEELAPHSCSDIRYITDFKLPSTLKKIDKGAFHYNLYIEKLAIPDSVTSIGDEAFMMMSKLKSITLGTGITEIPEACFYECQKITSINIPSNVKKIGSEAFACGNLSSITFNEGLEEIGSLAFMNDGTSSDSTDDYSVSLTKGLKTLVFPDSLTTLGNSAFAGNSALQTVTFGKGLVNFGSGVFLPSNSSSVASFKIQVSDGSPLSVKNNQLISANGKEVYLYTNTSSDANPDITVPAGIEKINDYVFYYIKANSISLPSSLKEIGEYAFKSAFNYSSKVALTIPDNVTTIGEHAFDMANIGSIRFGSGLKTIGEQAFTSASIENLTLPSGVKEVGYRAFFSASVKTLILNEGLETIGAEAFAANPSMSGTITIPSTLKSLGAGAFMGRINTYSNGVTGFSVAEGNNHFSIDSNGALYDKGQTKLYAYPSSGEATSYSMPNTVTEIADYALAGSQKLTGITLSNSLISIGESALALSKKIASITIPDTVTSIGYRAFQEWSASQTINMPWSQDSTLARFGNDWKNSCNASVVYQD